MDPNSPNPYGPQMAFPTGGPYIPPFGAVTLPTNINPWMPPSGNRRQMPFPKAKTSHRHSKPSTVIDYSLPTRLPSNPHPPKYLAVSATELSKPTQKVPCDTGSDGGIRRESETPTKRKTPIETERVIEALSVPASIGSNDLQAPFNTPLDQSILSIDPVLDVTLLRQKTPVELNPTDKDIYATAAVDTNDLQAALEETLKGPVFSAETVHEVTDAAKRAENWLENVSSISKDPNEPSFESSTTAAKIPDNSNESSNESVDAIAIGEITDCIRLMKEAIGSENRAIPLNGQEELTFTTELIDALAPGQWYWQTHLAALRAASPIPDNWIVEMSDEMPTRQPLQPHTTDIAYIICDQYHWTVIHLSIDTWSTTLYDSMWYPSRENYQKASDACESMLQNFRRKCRAANRQVPLHLPILTATATTRQNDGYSCGPLAFCEIERLIGIDVSSDQERPLAIRARHAMILLKSFMKGVEVLARQHSNLPRELAVLPEVELTTKSKRTIPDFFDPPACSSISAKTKSTPKPRPSALKSKSRPKTKQKASAKFASPSPSARSHLQRKPTPKSPPSSTSNRSHLRRQAAPTKFSHFTTNETFSAARDFHSDDVSEYGPGSPKSKTGSVRRGGYGALISDGGSSESSDDVDVTAKSNGWNKASERGHTGHLLEKGPDVAAKCPRCSRYTTRWDFKRSSKHCVPCLEYYNLRGMEFRARRSIRMDCVRCGTRITVEDWDSKGGHTCSACREKSRAQKSLLAQKVSDQVNRLGYLDVYGFDFNKSGQRELALYMRKRFIPKQPTKKFQVQALEKYDDRVRIARREAKDYSFVVPGRPVELLVVCCRFSSTNSGCAKFESSTAGLREHSRKVFVERYGQEPAETMSMGLLHHANNFSLSCPLSHSRTKWNLVLSTMKALAANCRVTLLLHGRDGLCVSIDEWILLQKTFNNLEITLIFSEHLSRISTEILTGWQQVSSDRVWQEFDLTRLMKVHRGEVRDIIYERLLQNWGEHARFRKNSSEGVLKFKPQSSRGNRNAKATK